MVTTESLEAFASKTDEAIQEIEKKMIRSAVDRKMREISEEIEKALFPRMVECSIGELNLGDLKSRKLWLKYISSLKNDISLPRQLGLINPSSIFAKIREIRASEYDEFFGDRRVLTFLVEIPEYGVSIDLPYSEKNLYTEGVRLYALETDAMNPFGSREDNMFKTEYTENFNKIWDAVNNMDKEFQSVE